MGGEGGVNVECQVTGVERSGLVSLGSASEICRGRPESSEVSRRKFPVAVGLAGGNNGPQVYQEEMMGSIEISRTK